MKIKVLFFICLIGLFPFTGQARSGETFFAKTIGPNGDKVYVNDSAIVSIYLYASRPIGDIQINDKKLHVKGCRARRAYFNQGRRQSITRLDDKVYYTVLCAQYIVVPSSKGKYSFPELSVTANLYIEQEEPQRRSPGFFFDPFEQFFRQPTYKKQKQSLRTPSKKFEVISQPPKTMQELEEKGRTIL